MLTHQLAATGTTTLPGPYAQAPIGSIQVPTLSHSRESVPVQIPTQMRGRGFKTTTSNCDVCLLFITAPSSLFQRRTDGQMILWRYITQTDYRVIAIYTTAPCGTFSQLPWTWIRCEVTAIERDTSCGRSVVGTSRERSRAAGIACCSSCGYRCGIRLYSQIASCTWRTFDFCK